MKTCEYLALRVAEMAQIMKAGFSAKDVQTYWPYKGIPYVDGRDKEEEKAEKNKSA